MPQTDYLVIGSGMAGLTFALEVAQFANVTILTKAHIQDSNTHYAQGGIAAAVGDADTWEMHKEDTLIAGAGLCDVAAVEYLVQQAPDAIAWLQCNGARFDLGVDHEFDLGREGGHSRHRIVRYGDRTGWEVARALAYQAKRNKRITIYENAFVTDLILADGYCIGASAEVGDMGPRSFTAKATLIASGGCGQIYANTTNPRVATADGIGLAARAGAEVLNMEFMQFHPTTLNHPQAKGFLITEAMRGAGAILKNYRGRRFMYDYDPRLELAPRDVVARAIQREMEKLSTWCVYLDSSHLEPDKLQSEFPTIWRHLRGLGIEIEKDWIPVVPAQHYMCGGITTDLHGKTNIPGLYASGEVACTGVHGANRLASNSLLEATVFSRAAAVSVRDLPMPDVVSDQPTARSIPENDAIRIRHTLQNLMSQYAAIFRTTDGLIKAQAAITDLDQEIDRLPTADFSSYAHEAVNMVTASRFVVDQALARKENVGLHYNADLA